MTAEYRPPFEGIKRAKPPNDDGGFIDIARPGLKGLVKDHGSAVITPKGFLYLGRKSKVQGCYFRPQWNAEKKMIRLVETKKGDGGLKFAITGTVSFSNVLKRIGAEKPEKNLVVQVSCANWSKVGGRKIVLDVTPMFPF